MFGLLKWPFRTRRRRRITIGLGILMLVMPVVSVELTSQSWFCNSCHIMNPYYASWKTGSHKEVECVNCHIPPGVQNFVMAKLNGAGQVVDDLLQRTSSKPSAQVSDLACTRSGCHDLAKVRTIRNRQQSYLFDHSKHLDLEYRGIVLQCTTCHSHVKGDRHFEVSTNTCIVCHLGNKSKPAAGQFASVNKLPPEQPKLVEKRPPAHCKTCHNPPSQPIEYRGLKIVHSEYLEYGAQCESCHNGVTHKGRDIGNDSCFSCHEFGIEKLKSVDETHRVHSLGRHKVECFSCHGLIPHGPQAQSMQLKQIDCRSCHEGQHLIQEKAYKSVDVEAALPSQNAPISPMFMVHVACTGCHINPRPVTVKPETGATVAAAVAKACDTCHKPGLGEQMVPLWQKNTHQLYDAAVKMLPAPGQSLSPVAKARVDEARHLLTLVRLDGSWGVHNPRYTQKLLEEAQQKLVEAKSLVPEKN